MADEQNTSIELLTINKLISKKYPVIKSLIAMKTLLTTNYFFYFTILCLKFIALLSLSSSKWMKYKTLSDGTEVMINGDNISFGNLIRYLTFFGTFSNILTYRVYSIFCYFLFFLQIICSSSYLIYFKVLKEKSDNKNINSISLKIYTIIFHFNLISSQHLIELCSFIYPIYFNLQINDEYVHGTGYKIQKYILFTPDQKPEIVLLITNTILILFYNFHIFYTFKLLNEPFLISELPMNIKTSNDMLTLFMMTSNLMLFHYFELLLSPGGFTYLFYKYSLFTFINGTLVIVLIKNFRKFNFQNLFNELIFFFFTFSVFSYLLEWITYITNSHITTITQLLFITISKLLLTLSFRYFYFTIKNYYFRKRCSEKIFKSYENKSLTSDEIECFYYFLNLFIKFYHNSKVKSPELSNILNIIKFHKIDCVLTNCKCKIIKVLTNYNVSNLIAQINEVLETTFGLPNFVKNKNGNYMFTQYLYYIRRSNLFAYSVLNFLIFNSRSNELRKEYSDVELYEMFTLLMIIIKNYREKLSQTNDFVDFKLLYSKYKLIKNYNRKIEKIIASFEILLNFKEKFIGSLKLDQKSLNFDSYILNSLDLLADSCKNFRSLYKDFKNTILSEKKSNLIIVELAYTINAFYVLFNKKVSSKILNLICIGRVDDKFKTQKYFNSIFNKYFNDNPVYSVIVDIKDNFNIKYLSYRLSLKLEVENISTIGKDINLLLPEYLREAHRNAMFNHFLVKRNSILSFETYVFTNSMNLFKSAIKVSMFIDLSKNMTAMANLKIIEKLGNQSYKFILNESYEVLALSKNFEDTFYVDYEALNYFKINLAKLYGVQELMEKNFAAKFEKLEKYNYRLNNNTLQCLTKYIFAGEDKYSNREELINFNGKQSNKDEKKDKDKGKDNPKNIRGNSTKVLPPKSPNFRFVNINSLSKSSHRQLNASNRIMNNNLIKSNNKNTSSNLQISLGSNLSNVEEVFGNNLVLSVKASYLISNLNRLIVQYQQINGMNDEVQHSKLLKYLEILKAYKYSDTFQIKVKLKKIYGTPFYIFSLKQNLNFQKFLPIIEGHTADSNLDMISLPLIIEKNLLNDKKNESTPMPTKNNLSQSIIFNSNSNLKTNYIPNKNISKDEMKEAKIKLNKQNLDDSKKKSQEKENLRIKKVKNLSLILIILLIVNFSISLSIFLYRITSFKISNSLFFINHWNNMQQSSLAYLHSEVVSLALKLDKISDFNTKYTINSRYQVTIEDLRRIISYQINNYNENFEKLLGCIRNSTVKIPKLEEIMYNLTDYNKTLLTWENINSQESFISAQQYVTTNSRFFIEENNYKIFANEFEQNFVLKNYNNNRLKAQYSRHSRLLYFMNSNVPFKFYDKFTKIKNLIIQTTEEHYNFWIALSTVLEIAEIIVTFIIFLFIYLILLNFDESIFSFILSIFLNLETGKKLSYKSNIEIIRIKFKLKTFKEFLSNFKLDNIKNLSACLIDDKNASISESRNDLETFYHVNKNNSNSSMIINTNINLSSSLAVLNNNFHQQQLHLQQLNYANISHLNKMNEGLKDYSLMSNKVETDLSRFKQGDESFSPIQPYSISPKFSRSKIEKFNPKFSSYEKKKIKQIKSKAIDPDDLDFKKNTITNGKIFKNIKKYKIKLIKIVQFVTFIVFILFIIYLTFNFLSNNYFFSTIEKNISLTNKITNGLPIISYIFNTVRLMVIENDKKYVNNYFQYLKEYEENDKEFEKFINSDNQDLPSLQQFAKNCNNFMNSTISKNLLLCKNNDPVCGMVVNNGLNSKGLDLSVKSVLIILKNIYKEFNDLKDSEKNNLSLSEYIKKYFNNEEFENINLQVEFVFSGTDKFLMEYAGQDMSTIFSFVFKLNLTIGLICFTLNAIVVLLIYVGYLSCLNEHLNFISYSSKKLNKILYLNDSNHNY